MDKKAHISIPEPSAKIREKNVKKLKNCFTHYDAIESIFKIFVKLKE